MAAIESAEKLAKVKAAYEDVQRTKLQVEKMNQLFNEKRKALGNLLGEAGHNADLEEKAIRLIGEAYLKAVHEKSE